MSPELLAQSLLNGIGLALVYVLVALGLTLIFSIMGIINFAHGEFYMLGGFVAYYAYGKLGVNYWLTLVVAVVVVGAAGALTERWLFAPLRDNPMSAFIGSLGLLWVLQSAATVMFGVMDKEVKSPFPGVIRQLGMIVSFERLVVIVCSAALIICLYVFIQRTRYGMALRAVAQDRRAAALQGINIDGISTLAFAIGCALAGVAGVLLAPVFVVSPFMGGLPVIKAFIIVILGGMGSFSGAMIGGLALGLIESVAPIFVPIATVDILSFVLVMLVLVLRPRGLLGRA
jgi:branched-chain amino acid transport system permease protein